MTTTNNSTNANVTWDLIMTDRLPASALIDIICHCSGRATIFKTRDYVPQFSLFLGAGASKSSGALLASEMLAEFKKQFASQYHGIPLHDQSWYQPDSAYSTLFEHLYPTASLRRDYIERLLEFVSPSLGYLYVVRLLEENIFNTVFTTNFDDLLNEACYLFSPEVRPMVCAHDSSVRFIRMSSTRPKILKLHGDFLYDNIRNTQRELESLETNMRDKFSQYAREFGLILIGYSGSDRSVMDIIEDLLLTRGSFSQGVFWCLRRDETPSPRVAKLVHCDGFHLVEIEGFDELMAELHESLSQSRHPVIVNPYRSLGIRMARMLNSLPPASDSGKLHSILKRDLIDLGKAVRDPSKQQVMPRPHNCMAIAEEEDGNFDATAEHVLKQLADDTCTIGALCEAFKIGIRVLPRVTSADFGDKLLGAVKASGVVETYPSGLRHNLRVVSLIHYREFDLALRVLDMMQESTGLEDDWAVINRAQILLRQHQSLSSALRVRLVKLEKDASALSRFGAKIILKKHKKAVDELEKAIDSEGRIEGSEIEYVKTWPICDLLSDTQKKRLQRLKPS